MGLRSKLYSIFHKTQRSADGRDDSVKQEPLTYDLGGLIQSRSTPVYSPEEMGRICLQGTAAGDIFGSSREGVPPKESGDYRTDDMLRFGRYTDDTVLTMAVLTTLKRIKSDLPQMTDEQIIRIFSEEYKNTVRKHLNLPYGGRFFDWAMSDAEVAPYESFGDGAAMRSAVIGAFMCNRPQEEVCRIARLSAIPSHSHPDAIKAATVTAMMAYLAANGVTRERIVDYGTKFYTPERISTARFRIAKKYVSAECTMDDLLSGWYQTLDLSCDTAVPLAIIAIRDNQTYEDCLRSVLRYEGDTDTIMAIAGGIYSLIETAAGKESTLQGMTLNEIWDKYVKISIE